MATLQNSVAIIGIACRFPGSDNLEEFWELLKNGENHVKEIPKERWDDGTYYDPNPDIPGKAYTNRAALLDRIYDWDNTAFGVNEYEAERMDPQHKLALQVTHCALENAGIPTGRIKGSNTSVYMGQMNDDYAKLLSMDPYSADNYTATGTAASILANRISYTFDLHGPSMTLDTACSSALVGVHLGVQSILRGESNMAVCGGVNLILSPIPTIALSKARMASKKGQSHAFSKHADGYTRGEGCGIVILKSAEMARREKNKIWGYITTGCNSDGKSAVPITSPAFESQKNLIDSTVARSGLQRSDIQYVEMHGTGTPVGDPVEASAVGQSIGQARKKKNLSPLTIGSVKTNIGHLESAAGMAGLIKVLLMMEHGQYVPSLFNDSPTESINFDYLHLDVSKETNKFPLYHGKRVASVNSFGFGGTNVHAIIQQSDLNKCNAFKLECMPYAILCFSGRNEKSVKKSIQDTIQATHKGLIRNVEEVVLTASNHRDQFNNRLGIVCKTTSVEAIREALQSTIESGTTVTKVKNANLQTNTVYVFCGMGTHWVNMGLEFYRTVPLFKDVIDQIDSKFYELSGFTLKECLNGEKDLNDPIYGQPTIFAVQVGIFEMLKFFGLLPDVILGHSVGEVAAAFASNHISLASAIQLIFHRSNLLKQVKGGGMLVIGNVPTREVEKLIIENGFEGEVCIAAYNSPVSCTVSGESDTVERLEVIIKNTYTEKDQKLFLRSLKVDVAFHSKFMDPIVESMKEKIKGNLDLPIEGKQIRHVSTVTGNISSRSEFLNEKYWAKNLRDPVCFETAFSSAIDSKKHNIVVEIGPRPALNSYMKVIGKDYNMSLFGTMRPAKCNDQLFPTIAKIYEAGMNILYRAPNFSSPCNFPRYGFIQTTLKKFSSKVTDFLFGGDSSSAIKHPFVLKHTEQEQKCTVSQIEKRTAPFVFDHIVDNITIVPGSTYVEMAAATYYLFYPDLFSRGKMLSMMIEFKAPCVMKSGTSKQSVKTIMFEKKYACNEKWEFDITTEGILHAQGELSAVTRAFTEKQSAFSIHHIQSRCTDYFNGTDVYMKLKEFNFSHGPLLQCVMSGQRNSFELIANIVVSDDNFKNYLVHPVLLDCLLQLCVMLPQSEEIGKCGQIIPIGIEDMSIISIPPNDSILYIVVNDTSNSVIKVDGFVMDNLGEIFIHCKGMKFGVVGADINVNPRDAMYQLNWREVKLSENKLQHSNKKYILLSNFRTKELQKFKDVGLANHVIHFDQNYGICDVSYFEDVLPNDTGSYTDILYGFGCNLDVDEPIQGNDLNDIVASRCYSLIVLAKVIQARYPHICINVLTRSVHSVMTGNDNYKHVMDGLVGYSIWGMMRTVLMEYPFQKYRTIDIASVNSSNLENLCRVLNQTDHGMEIAIMKGGVSSGSFEKSHQEELANPRAMNVPLEYAVTINSEEVVDDCYRELKYETKEGIEGAKDKCTVDFEAMYTIDPHIMQQIFPTKRKRVPVMSIGGKGILRKKEVHVIQFLPMCSKSQVVEKCVVPVSLLPCNTPSATIWFLSWMFCNEAKYIVSNTSFHLLANNRENVLSSAIMHMSLLMKYSYHMNSENLFLVANDTKDVRIHLDHLQHCYWKSISIITWSKDTGSKIENYLTTIFPEGEKAINVVSAGILQDTSKAGEEIMMFSAWLEKNNSQALQVSLADIDTMLQEEECHLSSVFDSSEIKGDRILRFRYASEESIKSIISKDALYKKSSGYMIFGGSKGLGWEIACHIAKNGAGKIGIISRNGLSRDKESYILEMQNLYGCQFIDLRGDVTQFNDVEKVFKEFQGSYPQKELRGIFFGTVVLADATIPNMTFSMFNKVLQPKVTGVWNIHQICKNFLDLDFFVSHSSIASMFGNPGQTNYSAANAFLDAYACFRKKMYGTGQSICWGALDLGILTDQPDKKQILSNLGIQTINNFEILESLDYCLLHDPVLICLAKINWSVLVKQIRNTTKRNAMKSLMWRKGHYIKEAASINQNKAVFKDNTSGFLDALLQTILMLEDEIKSDCTIEMLGGDSHHSNIIYDSIIEEFGDIPNLSRITIPNMTIAELQNEIATVTIKVDGAERKTSANEPQQLPRVETNKLQVGKKSTEQIKTDEKDNYDNSDTGENDVISENQICTSTDVQTAASKIKQEVDSYTLTCDSNNNVKHLQLDFDSLPSETSETAVGILCSIL